MNRHWEWPPYPERPPGRWLLWSEEWIAVFVLVGLALVASLVVYGVTR